jgi:stage IV sporulation protein FB
MTVRVGTLFRIPVRVHLLLPALSVVLVVTTPRYTEGAVLLPLLLLLGVLGVSTLLHELGHAFAARGQRLEAHGITLWPLGGSTECDRPRTPRAAVRVALAGVAVNLALALAAGAAHYVRDGALPGLPRLGPDPDLLATAWNVNLALAILNLLPGLPFDGGMALEALLGRRFGRLKARMAVLTIGALAGLGLLLGGISNGDVLIAALGGWCLVEVFRLYRALEGESPGEEPLLGVYDFSQGHTSLEDGAPEPDRRERRRAKDAETARREAARRAAADTAARESSRERLDGLLDRIAAEGIGSLSGEERAFLDEESLRLRSIRPGKTPTRP